MKNEKVLESIAEGSALLAEYLGWKPCDCGNKEPHYKWGDKNWEVVDVKDMEFHKSWDYLMPVINRISDHIYEEIEEDNGLEKRIIKDRAYPRTFGMISQEGKYMFRFNRQCLFEGDTLIEAAFSACVDFVTWIKSCGGAIDSKTSHETLL